MTYQYLLDTNILSDLARHPQGRVFQQIATVGEEGVCTSIIVACKLRFGALLIESMIFCESRAERGSQGVLRNYTIYPHMDKVAKNTFS